MKNPDFLIYKNYADNDELTPDQIIECCDSAVAVLTKEDLKDWLEIYNVLSNEEDAAQFCEGHTATMTFMIEEKLLVCVIDSGGEISSGEFVLFCQARNITVQTIVDSLNFNGCAIDEMYTGQMDNDPELMRLIHQITN